MSVEPEAGCHSSDSNHARLWAKTDRDRGDDRYHPLLFHMLDVAAVAGVVWEHHLSVKLRMRVERAIGVADAGSLIMFVGGAHDIGKACPGFQKKSPKLCESLALSFSENDQDQPHGYVSASVLEGILGGCSVAMLLARITGGHHGVFPRSMDLRRGPDTLGNSEWSKARCELLERFASVVGFDFSQALTPTGDISDPLVVPLLAGFISVVDWIGSDQRFFPCAAQCGQSMRVNAVEYWTQAQSQAREALETLGWLPAVTFAEEAPFDRVFPGLIANSLQKVVIELAAREAAPYLMIVEAPMGQGKTEAALYAADLAMCRGAARGMYVAMPTQATGNAMFKRVLDDYLKKRGHLGKLNLQLVHGDAILAQTEAVQEGEIPVFEPRSVGEGTADLEAQSWFTAKKRPLLAPFGVGTIDQSLLSVLPTRHWFVRLFGLARKVVLFDEVHAYDAYMSTILERLLHWLAELDCTVILLSATLPEAKRKALANAYSGRDDAEHRRYPRVTLARPRHYPKPRTDEPSNCVEIAMGEPRPVSLQFAKGDLQTVTSTLSQRLEHGGCAAVICNTVNRSIVIYKHLRDNLSDTECLLFHARTLQMWRREREAEVLRKFGKRDPQEKDSEGRLINPDRPARSVLVATQVIEQSLDLDFDLMVAEIAPIDLLLQRMGRLHRHDRQRVVGLASPQFIVLCDADKNGPPPQSFGKSSEYVYDRYILLRTWLALRGRATIDVPTEIESLVEAVYGESAAIANDGWEDAIKNAWDEMSLRRAESEKAAERLLVSRPKDPSDLIEEFNDQLSDDNDPEVHKAVRAATREGDPSITVVMLPVETKLSHGPESPEVRWLLDRSAKLSHKRVFQALREHGEAPAEWAKNAHLRHARVLWLDGQNQGRVNGIVLTVDEHLGIVIEEEEG